MRSVATMRMLFDRSSASSRVNRASDDVDAAANEEEE